MFKRQEGRKREKGSGRRWEGEREGRGRRDGRRGKGKGKMNREFADCGNSLRINGPEIVIDIVPPLGNFLP